MDWTKIGALGTIGCLVLALITLCLQLANNRFNPWVPLVIVGIGGTLLYSLVLWQKLQRLKRLPFRMLWSDCQLILSSYRKLAFDYPADARLPLNNASWPQYGDVWKYQHVALYHLKLELFEFLYIADMAYKARDIKSHPGPFDVDAGTMIVDLISVLEALLADLEKLS